MFTFNDLQYLPQKYPFTEYQKKTAESILLVTPTDVANLFMETYAPFYLRRSLDAYYLFKDDAGYWIEIPKYKKTTLEIAIRSFISSTFIPHLSKQYISVIKNRKQLTKQDEAAMRKIKSTRFVPLAKEATIQIINHIDIIEVPTTQFQPEPLNIHLISPNTDLAYILTIDHTQQQPIQKRLANSEDYVLKDSCIPIEYDPQSPPPPPTRSIKEVFNRYLPRPNELDYVLTNIFGMSLHGNCKYKQPKFFAFRGVGSNGKSTILNLFAKTLNPLTDNTINSDLIMQKKYGNQNYAVGAYQLRFGLRVAIPSSDITSSKSYVWNSETLKNCVRMEPISGSDKYVAATRFTPQATIMFSCNEPPQLEGQDTALLTRLEFVNMTVIFGGTPNPNLVTELIAEERLSLFHFFLQHMLKYQQAFDSHTLSTSPFEGAKQDYIDQQDGMRTDARVLTFINLYTEILPDTQNQFTTATDLAKHINKLFAPLYVNYSSPLQTDDNSSDFKIWKVLNPPALGKYLQKVPVNYRVKPADVSVGRTNPVKMYPLRYLNNPEILQKLHLHFTGNSLPSVQQLRKTYLEDTKSDKKLTFADILKNSDDKEKPQTFSEKEIKEESIYDDSVRDIIYNDYQRRFQTYIYSSVPELQYIEGAIV